MLKFLLLFIIGISLGIIGSSLQYQKDSNPGAKLSLNPIPPLPTALHTPIPLPIPPTAKTIPSLKHTYQTFNNCGPATLSMNLNYWGIEVSQQELGLRMRPYQNPQGDNDDKSVTLNEFIPQAQKYNLTAYYRPNGSVDLLKLFISNDIPVIVRTFITTKEDIGHYRIIRGYDDISRLTIQDDSYHGPNLGISYDDLLTMWQPFNYEFMVIVPQDKKQLTERILGNNLDEKTAWQNSVTRAQRENLENPTNPYPIFNLSVAYTHLQEYTKAVEYYEQISSQLPFRMLWYQIEPIEAYKQLGDTQKVVTLTNNILENQNRAFSELYQIRGELYVKLGQIEKAKQEFQKALQYNHNFEAAKKALQNLS